MKAEELSDLDPFDLFDTEAERLDAYRRFVNLLPGERRVDQGDIERAQRVLHAGDGGAAPSTRSTTERLILELLGDEESSAADVATRAGISRATAQRHIATLATRGAVEVTLKYGSTGRPEHRYRVAE